MTHPILALAEWTAMFVLVAVEIWQARRLVETRREVRDLTIRLVKLRVKMLTGKDMDEYPQFDRGQQAAG